MIDRPIPYEERRAKAWEHKQQLEGLKTFNSKLKYWVDNIDPYPHRIEYLHGENAPFTLSLEPKTDDDRRELHLSLMNFHRVEMAEQCYPVYKSFNDRQKVAFYVRLLDTLKNDLELRLSAAIRTNDLLQAELTSITKAIDEAGRSIVSWKGEPLFSTLSSEIEELRYSIETNRPYDLAFTNEIYARRSPEDKACRLAMVWDIVHYEAYLKDKLAYLKAEDLILKTTNSAWLNKSESPKKGEDQDLQYENFEDLILTDNFDECLDALRRFKTDNEKAVLGEGLNWIGGRKFRGVIVAWIERMENATPQKIRRLANRKRLVALLNNYFEDLNMGVDASVFNKPTKAEYCDVFKALMPS